MYTLLPFPTIVSLTCLSSSSDFIDYDFFFIAFNLFAKSSPSSLACSSNKMELDYI